MNKRASLSTFLFVLMVIVVCFTTFYAFAKHQNIATNQMEEVNLVVRAGFQEDVVFSQLRLFTEEAVFYAYNQIITEYSSDLKLLDGSSYNIFDYSKFQGNNIVSERDYNLKFSSLIQKRYDLLVSRYPSYIPSDEQVFLALKNAKLDFDGEKITAQTSISFSRKMGKSATISYSLPIDYDSSLSLYHLSSLKVAAQIMDSCLSTLSPDMNSRRLCILDKFYGFDFDKDFFNFKTIETEKGDFYLTKLVSKNNYFAGSLDGVNYELVSPAIFIVLPINLGDESKVRSLFGPIGGEAVASNHLGLLPPEQIPL